MSYNLSAADGLVPGFGTQKSSNAGDMFSDMADTQKRVYGRMAGAALKATEQAKLDAIQLKMAGLGVKPQQGAGGFWTGLAKTGLGALASGGFGAFVGGGGGGLGDLGAGAGDIGFAGVDSGVLDSVLGNAGQYSSGMTNWLGG